MMNFPGRLRRALKRACAENDDERAQKAEPTRLVVPPRETRPQPSSVAKFVTELHNLGLFGSLPLPCGKANIVDYTHTRSVYSEKSINGWRKDAGGTGKLGNVLMRKAFT